MEARTAAILGVALALGVGLAVLAPGDDTTPHEAPDDDRQDDDGAGNAFLRDGPRPAATSDVSGGSEPVILADDQDPGLLWVADTSGISRSTDKGDTWTSLNTPFTFFLDGIDLAQDDEGILYATTTNGGTITFSQSHDDGDTWRATPQASAPRSQPLDGGGVADRPWLAAHGDGQLGITWNPGVYPPGTRCLASFDGGLSWPDRGLSKSTIIAGENSFDDEGNLYWAISGTIYRLEPLSDLFGDDVSLCSGPVEHRDEIDAGPQALAQTETAGSTVYTAAPSSESDRIEVAFSDSWPSFRSITLDPKDEDTGNALASNTFVTLSATQDELALAWYGSETDGDYTEPGFDGAWNVYVAQIANPGDHTGQTLTCSDADVTCTRATDDANHVGSICPDGVSCSADRDLLDYFMLDHGADGTLHVAYAHDGSGSGAVTKYAQVPAS